MDVSVAKKRWYYLQGILWRIETLTKEWNAAVKRGRPNSEGNAEKPRD